MEILLFPKVLGNELQKLLAYDKFLDNIYLRNCRKVARMNGKIMERKENIIKAALKKGGFCFVIAPNIQNIYTIVDKIYQLSQKHIDDLEKFNYYKISKAFAEIYS